MRMTGRQKALLGQLAWIVGKWLIRRAARRRARGALARADAARLKAGATAARLRGRRGFVTLLGLGALAGLLWTLLARRRS